MANRAGAHLIFMGKSDYSAGQIDSIFAGSLPLPTTAVAPVSYVMAKNKGALSVERAGEMLELENNIDGLTDIVISGRDNWTIKFDIADITRQMIQNLTGLDPSAALNWLTDTTVIPAKLNYEGTSMLSRGFPLAFYLKTFDPNNTSGYPKVGSGSDPNLWVFPKVVLADRGLSLSHDPKGQLMLSVTVKPVAVDGTTNKGVGLVNGTFAALA